MRIWSIHPQYLDARGLVALWREALLAQAVLRGTTKGYRHHPQLHRFREQGDPVGAIAEYLREIHTEAARRGYRFCAERIDPAGIRGLLTVTRGQLQFERRHLLAKMQVRDRACYARLAALTRPRPHPLFRVIPGGIADWERS